MTREEIDGLEDAILKLEMYKDTIDNTLYHAYSVEGLKKELDDIDKTIHFLRNLQYKD